MLSLSIKELIRASFFYYPFKIFLIVVTNYWLWYSLMVKGLNYQRARFMIKESDKIVIDRYVRFGIPMNDYLRSIFANDLFSVIDRGGDESLDLLVEYVRYIRSRLPIGCQGSWESVNSWRGLDS